MSSGSPSGVGFSHSNVFRHFFRSGGGFIINRILAQAVGYELAFLLADLSDRETLFNKGTPGWFFCPKQIRCKSLGMSESAMERITRLAVSKGFLQTKMAGVPAKQYFLISYEKILLEIEKTLAKEGAESSLPETGEAREEDSEGGPETGDASLPETREAIYRALRERTPNTSKTLSVPDLKEEENPPQSNPIPSIPSVQRTKAPKPPEPPPLPPDPNEPYMPIAEALATIVETHRRAKVRHDHVKSWAVPIRLLCTTSKINPLRVQRALKWYADHVGGQYIPVIECGQTLREKFLKLEQAIEREKNYVDGGGGGNGNGNGNGRRKPSASAHEELTEERRAMYAARYTVVHNDR